MTDARAVARRKPCLIGVAQDTVREAPSPEPLRLWENVARAAACDAGAPGALARLDSVQIVHCATWPYDDPAGRLADRLGARPRHRVYSGMGGNTPLRLVSETADAIARGEMDLALLTGAEALATVRATLAAGERLAWSHRAPTAPDVPVDFLPHPAEVNHELYLAVQTFALMETARRATAGQSPHEERAERGAMMAPMTEVAAGNPYAWFPRRRDAAELVTPEVGNRMVSWPYTKYTVAVLDVDMAAAVLLASSETADALGVPDDRRVYVRGWAHGEDEAYVAARRELSGSPAMRAAAASAVGRSGIGLDEIGSFDLYSCFASALRFGCDAVGVGPLDPRGLTVTGGLPYAGGPVSNYTMHSVAAMTERLRCSGGHGLVSALGMHMAKHVYAVLSAEPGDESGEGAAPGPAADPVHIAETYEGPASVAAYTVIHGRDGAAERGVLVLDLPGGARTYASVTDPDLMADAESRELVGQDVRVRTESKVNHASW